MPPRQRLAVFTVGLFAVLAAVSLAASEPIGLPTGRAIEAPSGPVAQVGTLPEGLALSADGSKLFVVEGGTNPTAVRILDPASLAQIAAIPVKGSYGVPLADERGNGAWIPGANTDALLHVDAASGGVDRTIALGAGCWPSAVARIRPGLLAAACEQSARVAILDESSGTTRAETRVGLHPSAIAVSGDGARLFVTAWGGNTISVVEVATASNSRNVVVGLHPEALAVAGDRLFVANADDDSISSLDLRNLDAPPRTTAVRLGSDSAIGNSLSALALSPDGRRLYAVASAANAIFAFAIDGEGLRRLGAIPTGWYPTALAVTRDALFVANGLGEGSRANPEYSLRDQYGNGYIARTDVGSVRRLPVPDDATLRAGDARVAALAGNAPAQDHPVVRTGGPIKHVIYIVKENRTYDQVFGDLPGADGRADLVLFGENVTPNEHAIVRRFGIFDRLMCDAQVSPDGHNWSMGAIATDYVEKMWQAVYAHPTRRRLYDFESPVSPGRPHAGFLWDAAIAAGLPVRIYGEFVKSRFGSDPWEPTQGFVERTDPRYPGYDTSVSDLEREAEWEREFSDFERSRSLPALEILRLPNDHTVGTRPGGLTPQAMVAQNDEALGRIVEVVSHSKDWESTAIFAIEDDAQDGPDHVDEHRTTFLLASPYARPGVHHALYSTASVLRTIEIILGFDPMTTYDARALPLYDAFTAKADPRPYESLQPRVDLDARNAKTAYRAAESARLDLDDADAADAGTMNDILWHAIKGPRASPPPFGRFAGVRINQP